VTHTGAYGTGSSRTISCGPGVDRTVAYGEAGVGERTDRAFLSEIERGYFARFGHVKREHEFLAGRLAVRRALTALLDELPAELSIEREDDGAPRVIGVETHHVVVSITHAGTRALAIAAHGPHPVGIDLTEWSDAARIRKVARRAFPRAHERDRVLVDDRTAVRAWALKEAVAKSLRMGLLEQAGFERIEVMSVDDPCVVIKGDDRMVLTELADLEDGVRAISLVIDSKSKSP
jgi:4'-phosphopantetheinyl transferase EntD